MGTPDVPFVTVAVSTQNRQDMIGDCVASLVAQDFPKERFEVIVVDDGSTDATAGIVQRCVSDGSPSVRLLRQPYGGLSVARNRAVEEGRGELICFIDDDAIATPGWISAMVDAADRHPDVECFGGRLRLRLEGRPPRTCEQESLGATLDHGEQERMIDRVKGSNMAVRRSAFERIGLFNPALVWRGDEDDWLHRLHDRDSGALYVPSALVWHRRSASDLRLPTLLKTRFGWGVGQIQYKRETGVRFRPRSEIKALGRDVVHAVRDRCTGGLLQAAVRVGALWGGLFGELHKPSTEPPRLAPWRETQ